ncbi:MAG: 2-oxoacid:acceptor oxidoreductase subunit alpha [Chloroflexi bacterium]|nr:2-oxoacid:acceptor oxidoreductase subunit alpha [Chloroflexota bacterium]
MSQPMPSSAPVAERPAVVNDFSITVGTINGTGSQTSNLTLLRALFKMGIPVSGKNLFPSNIQGLPTWYTIRINKDGFLARRDEHEIVVAMNPATADEDLAKVVPGGVYLYADHLRPREMREDVVYYKMPVRKLARESGAPPKLRDYVANMVYVGVLAWLLGIDLDAIHAALAYHFHGKASAVDLNYKVVQMAYDWAAENLEKQDPYRVEPMDQTRGLMLTDGNTAIALGSLFGGLQFLSWYPITPASSVAETINEYGPRLRRDPVTGHKTYAIIQAEDELAAINMAIGAGWAGLRAMTSTSGPGISLMSEAVGLAYYAEVPVVVVNVQRVGPSTGLPTRTQQGDITFTRFLSHGDTEHIMLFPAEPNEAFEFAWRALDIAERLQTIVFLMSDLDLGMNHWMTKPFQYPDQPLDRGKVLWEEDLKKWAEEGRRWCRYEDVDGDGIPYRTVMGNRYPGAAYFTRGTGHDECARYSEDPDVWVRMTMRLKKKYREGRKYLPKPVVETMDGAKLGILAYGTTDPAVQEARHFLLRDHGIPSDYLRLRAIPFHDEVKEFLEKHDKVVVVEANRDGQVAQLLRMEYPELATRVISHSRSDGLPLTARFVLEGLLAHV